MRILIVSDLHANTWALNAIDREAPAADFTLCAGDVVNYGPDPKGAINWLQAREAIAVRGNHDHAVAFGVDPKASSAKQPLALAMRDWTRERLNEGDLGRLARLPLSVTWEIRGAKFALFHATPRDALFDYRLIPDVSDEFIREMTESLNADVLVVGHTHLPFCRSAGGLMIVNPGSVGQPLDGDARTAYALWTDGEITLHRADYDVNAAVAAINRLPIEAAHRTELAKTVTTGRIG